jgi:hypothetical protein
MTQFLFVWQSLVAGGLALLAGLVAFAGALGSVMLSQMGAERRPAGFVSA